PSVISFTSPYVSSKATAVTSVDAGVSLYATCGSETIITNETLSKNDDGTWGASKTYMWPSSTEDVVFYAYNPTTLSVSDNKVAVTIAATAGDQIDILASKTTVVNNDRVNTVNIKMNHMLSKVDFAFTIDADDVKNFNLKSFSINQIKGTTDGIDMTVPSITANDDATAVYTYDGEKTSAIAMNTSSLSEIPFSSAGAFMLIPQVITPLTTETQTGAYLEIEYSISFDGKIYPVGSATTYSKAYIPLPNPSNGWEAGKSYKYTLTIDEDFNGGYKSTTDISAANTYISASSKIKFDVSVESWGAENSTPLL
ncbi:MAG: fimbrillin family protein, partial [Rikenellaceae bacterium]